MLDLSHLDNLYYLGDFKNGKALIIFHNREASKYYFTLIDEKGNFQFEPVEWDEEIISTGYQGTQYDGKNNILIVKDGGIQSSTVAKCYDASGNLVGKFETDDKSKWFQIYDGVIVHHTYAGAYGKERIEYYNTDFTPLF